MVQKESEAQIIVLHSNNITIMPSKVTVHYRNVRTHHLVSLATMFYTCSMSMDFTVLTLVPQVIFHDITEKKKFASF